MKKKLNDFDHSICKGDCMTQRELKRTVFFDAHVASGAKMVDFGGWEMPIQYAGLSKEHLNTRSNVGLFDVSHMGEVWIEGADAHEAVKRWVTSSVDIVDGQAQYSLLCNEDGGIVDDIIVYRFSKERFLFCINAANREKDVAWLEATVAAHHDVQITNASDVYAQIAIQGRFAQDTLQKMTDIKLSEVKYYYFATGTVNAISNCIIARTGYTGEDGFEVFFPMDAGTEKVSSMWQSTLDAGAEYGIQSVGLGARDTLRLEARMNLYGNEMNDSTKPHEAGVAWTVGKDKETFIGKGAMMEHKKASWKHRLVGLVVDKRIARTHSAVTVDGVDIGEVTSGTKSPLTGKNIAMARIEKRYARPGTVVEVDIRGKKTTATVVKGAFFTRDY